MQTQPMPAETKKEGRVHGSEAHKAPEPDIAYKVRSSERRLTAGAVHHLPAPYLGPESTAAITTVSYMHSHQGEQITLLPCIRVHGKLQAA